MAAESSANKRGPELKTNWNHIACRDAAVCWDVYLSSQPGVSSVNVSGRITIGVWSEVKWARLMVRGAASQNSSLCCHMCPDKQTEKPTERVEKTELILIKSIISMSPCRSWCWFRTCTILSTVLPTHVPHKNTNDIGFIHNRKRW